MSGSRATHKKSRQRLAKTLRENGLPEADIAEAIAKKMAVQQVARDAARAHADIDRLAAQVASVSWLHGEVTGDGSGEPLPEIDDSAYRPAVVDPLLRGAARVTGMTAKAVRRGKALTRSEYARQENQR